MFETHTRPDDTVPDLVAPFYTPSTVARGTATTRIDDTNGVIFVKSQGAFSPDQVDAFSAQFAKLIEEARARFGRVRVFVDRRLSTLDSDATAERFRTHSVDNYRSGDRVAVLVESTLCKHLLKSAMDHNTHNLFVSERAAMMWLTAHDESFQRC